MTDFPDHGGELSRKSDRLAVRLSSEAKQTLEHAAGLSGRSLTDFVVSSALDAAIHYIEQHDRLRLEAEDRDLFLKALAHPPQPTSALRRAAAKYHRVKR